MHDLLSGLCGFKLVEMEHPGNGISKVSCSSSFVVKEGPGAKLIHSLWALILAHLIFSIWTSVGLEIHSD